MTLIHSLGYIIPYYAVQIYHALIYMIDSTQK